ncbi:MAG: hypothetical protein KAT00_12880, partial [Planctomycetes bacterium]|nr:hypothetical protein [Planctomycetota bacterium]
MRRFHTWQVSVVICVGFIVGGVCFGVTSRITRHSTASELLKGETKNVVVDSEGTIKLGRAADEIELDSLVDKVWIINSIVIDSDSTVYVGTSPNADIIKYTDGEAEKIYPLDTDEPIDKDDDDDEDEDDDDDGDGDGEDDDEDVADPNASETYDFSNEHVFAMALDAGGRLLAGISGQDCRLVRFDDDGVKTIFEPADAKYILA